MAHGFDCKRCKHQEASHEFPWDYPGVCAKYVSPDPKAEEEIWDRVRTQDRAPISDAVWLLTPFGIIDIGS